LINGLQEYKLKRNLTLNKLQFDYADHCIQHLQNNDLSLAYKSLKDFFDYNVLFQDNCGYSELITGVLLISNTLELCNSKLLALAEVQYAQREGHGLALIEKLPEGITPAYAIRRELDNWSMRFVRISLKDYFDLTDTEAEYFFSSIYDSLTSIITSRRDDKSSDLLMSENVNKNTCFFSALGASSRPDPQDIKMKVKVKLYEKPHRKAQY
jgi:hypothetical protein